MDRGLICLVHWLENSLCFAGRVKGMDRQMDGWMVSGCLAGLLEELKERMDS